MKLDRVKMTAFAAVLLMLVAYLAVFRPAEAAIAQRFVDLDHETTVLKGRLAVTRRAVALDRERSRLQAVLNGLHLYDDRARLMQRFLDVAAATARRRDVHIVEITSNGSQPTRRPGGQAPTALAGSAAPAALLFDELPFNLTVRGTYGALLNTARDLSTADLAVRLSIDALVLRDRRGRGAPQLTASIHATLLRNTDEQPTLRSRPI